MTTFKAAIFALFTLPLSATASMAATVPITGGVTTVELTADLGSLGLSPLAQGTASFDGATFTFPISGGTIDTGTGDAVIEHAGAGVGLFSGFTLVTLSDFVIDTASATVSGRVNGGGAFLPVFSFGAPVPAGIPLLITGTLASTLSAEFKVEDLTGVEFGIAATAPETGGLPVVPLPAALPLLAGAVALVWMVGRRKAT